METENVKETEETKTETETETETKFTQAELDAKIEERLARERKKMPTKEELSEFKEWKKTQVKQDDKEPEKIEVDNTELFEAKSEIELYKLQARPEFMEFLISKVVKMEGDNFKEKAEKVKKDNPQYFGEAKVTRMATAPRMNGGESKTKTTNERMNEILRGGKN